jgi:hypothetical protein
MQKRSEAKTKRDPSPDELRPTQDDGARGERRSSDVSYNGAVAFTCRAEARRYTKKKPGPEGHVPHFPTKIVDYTDRQIEKEMRDKRAWMF